MALFHKRPLALAGFFYLGTSLIAFFIGGYVKLILIGILVLFGVLDAVRSLHGPGRYAHGGLYTRRLIVIAAILALLLSFLYFDVYSDGVTERYANRECTMTATVSERTGSGSYGGAFRLCITSIDGTSTRIKAILQVDGATALQPGDIIRLTATPTPLSEFCTERSALGSLLSDGYVLGIRLSEDPGEALALLGEDSLSPMLWLTRERNRLSLLLSESVGGESGHIASALLLGDRSRLSDETVRDFRRSGASHLLAQSGFHVLLLGGMAVWTLRRLRIKKKLRSVLLGILMLGYLALTGFSPSACRAVIMLLVLCLSDLFSEEYDAVTALFVSGIIIMSFSPATVTDASFWMSFAAAFGILSVVPAFHDWTGSLLERFERFCGTQKGSGGKLQGRLLRPLGRGVRRLADGLAVGFVASVFVSFVMCCVFDELSLISPLISLLLAPPVAGMLVLSVLYFLACPVPMLGGFLSDAIRVLGDAMSGMVAGISRIPGGMVSLTYPFVPYLLFAMLIGLLVLVSVRLKGKWTLLIPPVCTVLAFFVCVTVWNAERGNRVEAVYFQTKGDGEVLVMTSPDGAVICDATDGYASRLTEAVRFVKEEGLTEIRAVVLTHYHLRHISGVGTLMRSEYIREVWMPYPEDTREYEIADAIFRSAQESGVSVKLYSPGQRITVFGNGTLTVEAGKVTDSAQKALLLRLSFDGKREDLVYCSSGIWRSTLREEATDAVKSGKNLIFGKHGPNAGETTTEIPSPDSAKTVVFADRDALMSLTFPLPDRLPNRTVCGAEIYRFVLDE